MKSNCHRSSGGVRIYVCLYNSTVLLYCAGVDTHTHTHIYIYSGDVGGDNNSKQLCMCIYRINSRYWGAALCVAFQSGPMPGSLNGK